MAKMKKVTVKVIRYDDTIAFQATYKAVNFADAIEQMKRDYKLIYTIDTRINCEYVN